MRGDMVFLALDQAEARAVRPYVSGMLPIYATSLSVNPRAEAIVNVDLQGVRYMDMPWFVQPDHPAVMVYPAPEGTLLGGEERLYAFGIDAYRLALLHRAGRSRQDRRRWRHRPHHPRRRPLRARPRPRPRSMAAA